MSRFFRDVAKDRGVLKNSYECHCERQSLEAISDRLRRVISNLFRLLRSAGGGPWRTPRKDNRRHFFNSPTGTYLIIMLR